jgi:antibiotic biosynthesis monooxygenase (ABM) superfamily enzyme
MSAPASVAAGQDQSVAFIITHTIKAGEVERYESWLSDILGAVSSFHGYLGREIFRPAQGTRKYTTIVRFDSHDHLNAWVESDKRKSFVSGVTDMLEKGDQHQIRTGVDFWFTPEGVIAPKTWKQFLLTLTAVYPLSLIIPRLLDPLLIVAPVLGNQFIGGLLVAAILTALLTFVVMPRLTRLMERWLYEENR